MSEIFDTHCHLYDLNPLSYNKLITSQAPILAVSKQEQDWVEIITSQQNKNIIPAIGIHPWFLDTLEPTTLSNLESTLVKDNRVQIGEIGLDFYGEYKKAQSKQIEIFKQQMSLAEKYQRMVSIHCRKAYNELLTICRDYQVAGVLHGFSSNAQVAKPFIKIGYKIGIGFTLLNPASVKYQTLVKDLPLETMVIESDAPYSTTNEEYPFTQMQQLVTRIAEIKQIDYDQVAKQLYNNAKEIINVPIR